MLSYLHRMWKEAPRALRLELLITVFVIELLALATVVVFARDSRESISGVAYDSASVEAIR